jgi:hypothetical protein
VEQIQVILESEEIGPESDGRKSSEIKEVIVLAASFLEDQEIPRWLVSSAIGYKYCTRKPKDAFRINLFSFVVLHFFVLLFLLLLLCCFSMESICISYVIG